MSRSGSAGALLLGLAASRVGLPPLVGFLTSGFVFSSFGMEPRRCSSDLAHAGVLLLLFAVGFKLRLKTLLRFEVWGTALRISCRRVRSARSLHLCGRGLSWYPSVVLALSLGFSSTVLAAKVLEGNRELRAVHGRVAIGILIVQDIVAVALLAVDRVETPVAVGAAALAAAVLAAGDRVAARFCGHGELLVLFGAVLAIGGGEGFRVPRPELGARRTAARHDARGPQRAQELTNVLWGLKELFLVGFFLNIGFSGPPTWEALRDAVVAAAVLAVPGNHLFPAVDRVGVARAHELPHGR